MAAVLRKDVLNCLDGLCLQDQYMKEDPTQARTGLAHNICMWTWERDACAGNGLRKVPRLEVRRPSTKYMQAEGSAASGRT
jgi:hypothetical protein